MPELVTPDHLQVSSAERAVLGSILLNSGTLDVISATLEPEDFNAPQHQTIFKMMRDLASKGVAIDVISLIEGLRKDGTLDKIGGEGYVMDLGLEVASSSHIETHGKLVYQAAEIRRLINACALIIEKGQTGDYDNPSELFDEAQQLIFRLGSSKSRKTFTSFEDAINLALEKIRKAHATKSKVTGTGSGFIDLDAKTAGFQPGELIILAARPGMGKTALALNMALNATLNSPEERTIAIFSLEMPTIQLATRMLASEAKVNSENLKTGFLQKDEIDRLISTVERLQSLSIFIDDTAGLSIMDCRSKCRRLAGDASLPPIGLVIIDYLQLMKGSPDIKSREQEISDISRNLKTLAKELEAPVIALSQLNRGVESRPNKRPLLSDLRESGAIEQDADMILFVYRDEYYNPESEDQGIAEVIIAKNRSGSLGTSRLQFMGAFTKFSNLVHETQF